MKLKNIVRHFNGWVLIYEADFNESYPITFKPAKDIIKDMYDFDVINTYLIHDDLMVIRVKLGCNCSGTYMFR